jgi:hypothetical protein
MEEGSVIKLKGETFALQTGTPAQFAFLSSSIRQDDEAGVVLEDWSEDELELASQMTVELDASPELPNPVPVQLGAKVTEVGTLELFFDHPASERRWKLEYQVREA